MQKQSVYGGHPDKLESASDLNYFVLLLFHPLRLEEVLGLKWSDIDTARKIIHVRRAVTHPTRNRPEVKDTKTTASMRDIGLAETALSHLTPGAPDEFICGGKEPLSYTRVRRMNERIARQIGFSGSIVPRRFRKTVLTDLYDQTKDIKLTQAAAGHTTSAMTLKHYVKGRQSCVSSAAVIDTGKKSNEKVATCRSVATFYTLTRYSSKDGSISSIMRCILKRAKDECLWLSL